MKVKRDTCLLKGKMFDVSYVINDGMVAICSIEKNGENFGDILDPRAILSIRDQLEFSSKIVRGHE